MATYDGEFETEFPIVLQRLESGRELRFELGEGGCSCAPSGVRRCHSPHAESMMTWLDALPLLGGVAQRERAKEAA